MPGKSSAPARSMVKKLSLISCLTVLETQPLSRSSFKLEGRICSAVTTLSPQVLLQPLLHFRGLEAEGARTTFESDLAVNADHIEPVGPAGIGSVHLVVFLVHQS